MRTWLNTFPRIGETVTVAQTAERAGFFGILLTDSQCLFPETFIELCMAGRATTQLHLGTCASNVVTRHCSVLASQTAGMHAETSGRMHLGLARGDSSVTKIGLKPLSPTEFGHALQNLRNLVAGREANIGGTVSSLEWVNPHTTPPDVFGVASGPRTIDAAAKNADGIILQVGSDPKTVKTWISKIRELQPDPNFRIASYVIFGITDKPDKPSAVGGVTTLLARMATKSLTEIGSAQAHAAENASKMYTLSSHGLANSATPAASNGYAITGTVGKCRDQLLEIAAQGCDELVVILGSVDTATPQLVKDIHLFGSEILPELNRAHQL